MSKDFAVWLLMESCEVRFPFVGNEEENWRVSHTEVEPPLLRHGSAHSRFGRKKGVVV
jgi:hypothetical protein